MKATLRSVSRHDVDVPLVLRHLLPAVKVHASGMDAHIYHDGAVRSHNTRDYNVLDADLDGVDAIIINDALLSGGFVVHDNDFIYLDTSIHSDANNSAWKDEVSAQFLAVVATSSSSRDDRYIRETALVLHNEGGGTWGHFLIQNLPKASLFRQQFPQGKIVLPSGLLSQDSSFREAIVMLGFREDQLLPVELRTCYAFKNLVIITSFYNFNSAVPHPYTLDMLAGIGDQVSEMPLQRRMYVQRVGHPAGRSISNQSEVDDVLEKYAIGKLSLGLDPLRSQIAAWKSCELAVCTLGSDLTNMVFAPRGTRLLVISPDWFSDAFFYHLAIMMGHRWAELRCTEMHTVADIEHRSSFKVHTGLLASMISD